MSVDWYKRHLGTGGAPSPAPVVPRSTPPTGPTPQAPQVYQPYQQQGTAYQPQDHQVQAEEEATNDGNWFNMLATRGAASTKKPTQKAGENFLCPECGSNQFFTRASTAKRGPAPAPHCAACGYNGLFEQFGNQDVPES